MHMCGALSVGLTNSDVIRYIVGYHVVDIPCSVCGVATFFTCKTLYLPILCIIVYGIARDFLLNY